MATINDRYIDGFNLLKKVTKKDLDLLSNSKYGSKEFVNLLYDNDIHMETPSVYRLDLFDISAKKSNPKPVACFNLPNQFETTNDFIDTWRFFGYNHIFRVGDTKNIKWGFTSADRKELQQMMKYPNNLFSKMRNIEYASTSLFIKKGRTYKVVSPSSSSNKDTPKYCFTNVKPAHNIHTRNPKNIPLGEVIHNEGVHIDIDSAMYITRLIVSETGLDQYIKNPKYTPSISYGSVTRYGGGKYEGFVPDHPYRDYWSNYHKPTSRK